MTKLYIPVPVTFWEFKYMTSTINTAHQGGIAISFKRGDLIKKAPVHLKYQFPYAFQ